MMRNNELKTSSAIEFSPEFRNVIDDVNSQIGQLDETLSVQHDTMEKLKDNFRRIQTDVVRELDVATSKSDKYMNTFQTIINYKTKMASNAEIKEKCTALECELFQKRYEMKRKKEKLEEEENQLTLQLHELKQTVRQQAVYNRELSRQYVQLRK